MMDYLSMGPVPVYLGVAFSEEDYARELRRLKVTRPAGDLFVPVGKDGTVKHLAPPKRNTRDLTLIICIRPPEPDRKVPNVNVAALLVHESVHAWQWCRLQMGENAPGHEVEAYAIQWISQFLMSKYAERVLKLEGAAVAKKGRLSKKG